MINLSLSRPSLDENGNQLLIEEYDDGKITKKAAPNAEFTIKVPLLSVIPINSLGVQSAEINFEMEVKSSSEEKTSESSKKKSEGSGSLKLLWDGGLLKLVLKVLQVIPVKMLNLEIHIIRKVIMQNTL